jgi:hypothetical protein
VAWCLLYYLVRLPPESRAPEKTTNQVKAAEVAGELEEVTTLAYSNAHWRQTPWRD